MLIILTFDRTGISYESSLRLGKTCLDLLTFCVFHVYEKLSFYTPCWDAFTKYGHEFLGGSQLFASLCFFFLLNIRQDIFSVNSWSNPGMLYY